MASPKNIAVIGAGIAGITAAYWLARNGALVTVYDEERYPAMKTSYANGSQLSVCNSPTWNTWGTVYKGMKWLLKKDAPFYINPSPDPAKIAWLARFISNTAQGMAEVNTRATVALALAGRRAVDEIEKDDGINFDRVSEGIMHIYSSLDGFLEAKSMESLMTSSGCQWDIIGPSDVVKIEPSLAGSTQIVGGVYTKDDSTGDMHKFCVDLTKVMASKYGVKFLFGHRVDKLYVNDNVVIIDGQPYTDVVIASGVAAPRMAKEIGDRICIYPVKGYSITIDLNTIDDVSSAPWVSMLDEDAKIVCSRLGRDRLRVAGTAEINGYSRDITMARIEPLLRWTNKWFPTVSTRSYRPWAGLRPMTPDLMPIVGRLSRKRAWYHAGHGHLGWTIAPGTAKSLAAEITRSG
jgi:D-amino-acid dehydrogenase